MPLWRRAERDPSTPNPVSVVLSTGGPHTSFAVHFRVALIDAASAGPRAIAATTQYRFSGSRCQQITFPGGGGGGANDVRGRIWSDRFPAVQGQASCPGTYTSASRLWTLGRAGALRRPAAPFGSATFTVRR